jgi:drug/metabolite transporter (DMT)-like permease
VTVFAGNTMIRAYWLGFAAIAIFSVTLPVSKIAVSELPPAVVTFGRALVAGLCSCVVLAWRKPGWPERSQWKWIALCAFGVVFGFPYFSTLAMQSIPASQGAIVTGMLPLATALMGALLNHERLRLGFWLWSLLGFGLVVLFAFWRGAGQPLRGDFAMFAAVVLGALGYACGGKLATNLGGINTICWALAVSLPINLLLTALSWPSDITTVSLPVFLSMAYLALFSMFIGFFFWYNALAQGGIGKVGLIQLLQPFLTVMFASALNREPLQWLTVVMAVVVAVVVFNGRRA